MSFKSLLKIEVHAEQNRKTVYINTSHIVVVEQLPNGGSFIGTTIQSYFTDESADTIIKTMLQSD